MSLTWRTVDKWREEKGMPKADLARAAHIGESTMYRGLRNNSKLQPSTRRLLQDVFPDKFNEKTGEVLRSGEVLR
ncbi:MULTISPECIES: hypothetical protein [unclassified Rhizobium]|nr:MULTISPECIES: hypothetical protein [unclassified Rhizobium]MBB3386014.1 hypothetical protein [Rhizobium sp. BK098]MBB3617809.1 hypothetical protein [Rhizobium sp. BK609]MBB3683376.1 hypothetical protein [Rhizobium sp. BK612]